MKDSIVQVTHRVMQYSGTFIMLLLASYSIWYCHTALSPFSRMKRIITLDQRVRTALFQSESIQMGFLLTGDTATVALYSEARTNLRTQVNLFSEEISGDHREQDVAREIETLVKLKIDEMDSTMDAVKRRDSQAAINIFKTNIGRNYTAQICSDLNLIRGIETGRTYAK